MAISFTCGTCNKPYKVDERFAGKKAACRACGAINQIPSGGGAVAPPPTTSRLPPAPVHARFPSVADPLQVTESDAIPFAEMDDDPADATAAGGTSFGDVTLAGSVEPAFDLAEDPAPPPPRATVRKAVAVPAPAPAPAPVRALPVDACPQCGSPLESGAVFCTGCGFNLKTGRKISTTVVDGGGAGDTPDEYAQYRPAPNPAMRKIARSLIIAGLAVSILPIFGLAWKPLLSLASYTPLLGALLAMVGAVMYFIDGAWQFALGGCGAMLAAIFILLTLGGRSDPPVVAAAPPPPPPPATLPTTMPDPGPKVVDLGGGKFSVRPPGPNDDPVDYWKPELQDNPPSIKAVVLGQLALVGEDFHEPAADLISESAADPDLRVRRAATAALAVGKTEKSLSAALRALDDQDPATVRAAVKVLATYKDDAAIAPLANKYATVGESVLTALAGYPRTSHDKVAEAYKPLLTNGADAKTRVNLIGRLVQIDPANAGAALVSLLNDGDPVVRDTAIAFIGDLKYTPAADAIAERLREDPDVAAPALIHIGPPAETAAANKLQDTEPKVRLAALRVLAEVASLKSLPAIQTVAKDANFDVAMAARDVWRKLVPGALPPIEEALLDLTGEKDFQARALKTLKDLPVDEHQPLVARRLFQIIDQPAEAPLPALACDALLVWADKTTRDKMIDLLKPEADDAKRACAIRLAVEAKDPRALRPLCECLAQSRDLANVMDALQDFGTVSETYLMRLVSTGDTSVQTNAFKLLREIGTRRCYMVLTPLANNKNTDADTKKRAKETIIAINRRLNTAAATAHKAPPLPKPVPLPPINPANAQP